MKRNHQELSKLISTWLQAMRGGAQNARLHNPVICEAEKSAADAIARFIQVLAAEMILAAAEEKS